MGQRASGAAVAMGADGAAQGAFLARVADLCARVVRVRADGEKRGLNQAMNATIDACASIVQIELNAQINRAHHATQSFTGTSSSRYPTP
ncbi:hypothetical protein PT2222_70064 [Paraburkholderia tropica]